MRYNKTFPAGGRTVMKDGEFVSNALDYESFQLGQINLIVANCGSGKSTAVYKTIPEKLNTNVGRILVLIDTVAGKDSFIKEEHAQPFGDFPIKPTIMTYAAFGSKIKKAEIRLKDWDMIVCDEIHNMIVPVRIARNKLQKQFPEALPWEINDMLKMTNYNYIAIEMVSEIARKGEKWVFGLTATPRNLQRIAEFEGLINEVKFSQALRAYEIISSFDYTDIETILRAAIPDDRKRVFFFSTVKELKKYKEVLLEAGRQAEAIWSTNHEENMNSHQLSTRAYLLEEHKLPDDVQDLLFNSAYETAITIKDKGVKEMYIHTGNEDTRTQSRNRLRQDLEVVGYYDSKKAENQKRVARENNRGMEELWVVPESYINVKLDKKKRDEMITEIGFPKKWTSFRKWLEGHGYRVEEKIIQGATYYTILIDK